MVHVTQYSFGNADIVSSLGISARGTLGVSGTKLSKRSAGGPAFDLKGSSFVYPALINVHDHMNGNYLPRVGPKGDNYYVNWSYWDADLKSSPVYEERANLNAEQRYDLSAYKNLFSGVATVNDHFPHDLNDKHIPRLPIRVIQEYTLAHECSSFELKWGDGIEIEHARAVEKNWPFITHLEEGYDAESRDGVAILERLKCLDEHDLFIHCIGFSDEDIAKTAKAGASISWCPGSNFFMFNATCKIRKILKAGINVSIGTDSTHTGSVNLLEEMRYARKMYQAMYNEDLSPKQIFSMVTANPAKAFRMQDRVGDLLPGMSADILIAKAKHADPYENLVAMNMEDIEFLSVAGTPVLADRRFAEALPENGAGYEEVRMGGRQVLVKGKPVSLYKAVRKALGFKKKLEYLPFDC